MGGAFDFASGARFNPKRIVVIQGKASENNMTLLFDLTGKTLVTGSARGLGFCLRRGSFAAAGARVILNDIRAPRVGRIGGYADQKGYDAHGVALTSQMNWRLKGRLLANLMQRVPC